MAAGAPLTDQRQRRRAIAGSLWVLFAVTIWVGWILSTRLGVGQATGGRLDPWDIAFLRFFVAGILLLPVVLRRGLGLDRLGLAWFAVLVAGAGAVYVMVVTWALHFAPAADAAALLPGTMPMFVAVLAYTIMRDRLDKGQLAGLALTLAGVGAMMASGLLAGGAAHRDDATLGHVLLLTAAFLWASSTLAMKRGGLAPLHGTAIVAVVSLALYGPFYLAATGTRVLTLPLAEASFHAFYQGVMTSVVSLIAYMRGIALLGPARGAAFSALVPVMVALAGIPLLGEWPAPLAWLSLALTAAGVVLASGVLRALKRG